MFRVVVLVAAAAVLFANPESASIFQHALELHKSGDLNGAIAAYREFLKTNPRSVDARINLGAALSGLGRYQDAITEYEQARRIDTANPGILLNLGLAYYKSGQIYLASTQFAAARALIPDHMQLNLLLADCWLRLGENEQVVKLLEPLEQKNPDDLAIAYLLGTALVRANHPDRGQVIIDKILRNGDSAEARLLMGATKMSALDHPGAIQDLKRAIELNPKLPELYSYYGRALLANGDSTAAREAFLKELENNPNDFDANLQLGLILRQDQDYDGATKYLKAAGRLRQGDLGVRYQLAVIDVATGRTEEARKELEAITAKAPNFVEAHISLATLYYRLKRKEDGDREREIIKKLKSEEAQPRK